jgi:hypothetical protein
MEALTKQPKEEVMNIIMATLETCNFTFDAIAHSPVSHEIGKKNLTYRITKMWEKHCEQTGADPDYFTHGIEDAIYFRVMSTNGSYRDREDF